MQCIVEVSIEFEQAKDAASCFHNGVILELPQSLLLLHEFQFFNSNVVVGAVVLKKENSFIIIATTLSNSL